MANKKKLAFIKHFRPRVPRYFIESIREIRRVTWPGRKEAWKLTSAVMIFTTIFTVFAVIADAGFDWLAEKIFL